jgi:hypothetical protein
MILPKKPVFWISLVLIRDFVGSGKPLVVFMGLR